MWTFQASHVRRGNILLNNIHALLDSVDGGTTHLLNAGKYIPVTTA